MVIANIHFHLVLQFLKVDFSQRTKRGDVVVFKTPADNRTDYIKRLNRITRDQIQFIDSNLYINKSEVLKSRISKNDKIFVEKKYRCFYF